MSLYVEVMCDERLPWPSHYRGMLRNRCLTDRGDNPQGPNVKAARAAAREQGWKLDKDGYACCPKCLKCPPEPAQWGLEHP
jgi:hypothetical protein